MTMRQTVPGMVLLGIAVLSGALLAGAAHAQTPGDAARADRMTASPSGRISVSLPVVKIIPPPTAMPRLVSLKASRGK
jgi:hypothetical protein